MGKSPVRVTIIDDPMKRDCEASCGTDWSSLHTLEITRKQVRERFNDDIRITYLDLSGDTGDADAPVWQDEIKRKKLRVPLLIVNGRLRISGNFDIRQILDVLEAELEMEAKNGGKNRL